MGKIDQENKIAAYYSRDIWQYASKFGGFERGFFEARDLRRRSPARRCGKGGLLLGDRRRGKWHHWGAAVWMKEKDTAVSRVCGSLVNHCRNSTEIGEQLMADADRNRPRRSKAPGKSKSCDRATVTNFPFGYLQTYPRGIGRRQFA